MNDRPGWDLFISYRATKSMFVRQVADQLISAKCRVWFAEYKTCHWRLRQNDRWVDEQIAAGIEQSAWGIVFASHDYLGSPACVSELSQLLGRQGYRRILQISLDGARLEPLINCETVHCRPGEVMEAVDFIVNRVGMRISNPARPGRTLMGDSKRIVFGGLFILDAYGWRRWWRGALAALLTGRHGIGQTQRRFAEWGPFLQREVHLVGSAPMRIYMNLRFGMEQKDQFDNWLLDYERICDGKQEREVFNRLNEYASTIHFTNIRHAAAAQIELHGVHLLLNGGPFGHLAMTYKVVNAEVSEWHRKISIHLRYPGDPSSYYEFVFTFGFAGSFEEYCRHTGVMDELALSVGTL
ncbi:MAG: TIR domain-containing protein [Candidatus Thiodiazotropha sp. (ex Epidulcina cf. delphinae)]|nr:TIR domain-containing protein [Candidatus Thiodiazotropha sp. (ex Epidulcina cf. delphinae)]